MSTGLDTLANQFLGLATIRTTANYYAPVPLDFIERHSWLYREGLQQSRIGGGLKDRTLADNLEPRLFQVKKNACGTGLGGSMVLLKTGHKVLQFCEGRDHGEPKS